MQSIIIATLSQICMVYYNNRNSLSNKIAISIAVRVSTYYLLF